MKTLAWRSVTGRGTCWCHGRGLIYAEATLVGAPGGKSWRLGSAKKPCCLSPWCVYSKRPRILGLAAVSPCCRGVSVDGHGESLSLGRLGHIVASVGASSPGLMYACCITCRWCAPLSPGCIRKRLGVDSVPCKALANVSGNFTLELLVTGCHFGTSLVSGVL